MLGKISSGLLSFVSSLLSLVVSYAWTTRNVSETLFVRKQRAFLGFRQLLRLAAGNQRRAQRSCRLMFFCSVTKIAGETSRPDLTERFPITRRRETGSVIFARRLCEEDVQRL